MINRDLNIDQNNRDYHFGHNRAALRSAFPEAVQFNVANSLYTADN